MFRIAEEISRRGGVVLTTTTTKMMTPSPEQCRAVIISSSTAEIFRSAERLLKGHSHIFVASRPYNSDGKLAGFEPEIIATLWESGLFRWVLVEADGASRRPLKAPASHEPVIPAISQWVIAVIGLDAIGKPLDEKWVFRPQRYSEVTGLPLGAEITEGSIAIAVAHEMGIMKGSPPHALRVAFLNKAEQEGALDGARRVAGALSQMRDQPLSRIVVGSAALEHPIAGWYDLGQAGRNA